MKKKYELPQENPEENPTQEPAMQYDYQTESKIKFSPPLTEEELKDSMSTEEFKKYWFKCIDDIFEK